MQFADDIAIILDKNTEIEDFQPLFAKLLRVLNMLDLAQFEENEIYRENPTSVDEIIVER